VVRRTLLSLSIVGAVAAVCAPSASAASPCPSSEWSFTSPAKSRSQDVTVPSVVEGSEQSELDGVIVRPRKIFPKHRKLPGVVLLHGRGGNLCSQWWAARLLASHGYIALAVTMDPGADSYEASDISDVAARSSVEFLLSPDDPYRSHLDRHALGIAGHSQGGMGASRAQSDLPQVKAIVGMDNLRKFGYQDPGSPGCLPGGSLPVTPTVPGLGIGSETGCKDDPSLTDKLAGYHAWRVAGLPTMEVVLAHSTHGWFSGGGSQTDVDHLNQLKASGYYMRAWFDRWLKGHHGADDRLLSSMPMGIPIDDLLTAKSPPAHPKAFHSAAFLPALNFDCENLRVCL
jgi:pimeloyl-ACP methyl ester carboxylesterase